MTSPLGLESGVVRLVEYDPAWPELFRLEALRIAAALAPLVLRLEHIGSTAVPGLVAKPVLDILAGYEAAADLPAIIAGLTRAEYLHRGEQGIPGREFFRRGHPRAYHVHLTAVGGGFWRDHLGFRDLLRSDAGVRDGYAALKRELASRFPRNREAYIEGKGPFVLGYLSRMSERQYSDEEVAAIFEQASKTEHAGLPASAEGKGMTLAALQDIGREVGISPEAISLAARSLDQVGRPAARTFMGLPIGVGRTIEFDRPLSDADWEGLVADLRTTFEARGAVRYDGPFRQWTNGNLQALLEPTPTGHRLRLQTMKSDSRAMMGAGTAAVGGAVAVLVTVAVTGTLDSAAASGVGFMALMGMGLFATGALRVSGWAKRRKAQIDEIIARLMATRGERR